MADQQVGAACWVRYLLIRRMRTEEEEEFFCATRQTCKKKCPHKLCFSYILNHMPDIWIMFLRVGITKRYLFLRIGLQSDGAAQELIINVTLPWNEMEHPRRSLKIML